MKSYIVGGAVRDRLLGLPVTDRDHVVVGATVDEMRAAGFIPVGRDFPVFLHPQTHEEYALARTERKTEPGYKGFVFHAAPAVTLEQDLARRDLTINAMAEDESGGIIDPFGGRRDLDARIFRHVGPAFVEDPVRILRVARFAARFAGFGLASETLALMKTMVEKGEVDALVPERIWQELSRGLMEAKPSRMLETLRACGALARILPEVDRLWGVPQPAEHHPEIDTGVHNMMVIDMAARLGGSLAVRFAALTHDLGKGTTPPNVLPRHIGHEARSVGLLEGLCRRLRVPNECRDLAVMVAREHGNIHRSSEFGAEALLRLFDRCDAFRRPQRFFEALTACEADARGRLGFEEKPYLPAPRLMAALNSARAVDAGAIARSLTGDSKEIANAVRTARVAALR